MFVETLVLQNFQCFGGDRTVISLDPELTAFIGVNGAGKTAACRGLQRLFGVTNDERTVRVDDFHVPPSESGPVTARSLVLEAVLAFPELAGSDDGKARLTVPEFFLRMAAQTDGTLKCRIVLEASWQDDGTLDGSLVTRYWVVNTLDEQYTEQNRVALPPSERSRIQMLYVPASRDGTRQIAAFLRGRLWRAAQWSQGLQDLLSTSSEAIRGTFHNEPATAGVEEVLARRWTELHGAGTHAVPRFEPLPADINELLQRADLVFEPDHAGMSRPARMLSDGQRSLLHLALTAATLDVESSLATGPGPKGFDLSAAHLPTLTLLAVEEPENSLAPFYLSRIVTQLLSLGAHKRAQVLLSSHSASAVGRVEPKAIRHFRLDVSSASVRGLTLPDGQSEAGKYVREAVRAHPELYFARFVILGEGDTEEIVIPRIALASDVVLDPSFVAMVPLGGRHTNHFWTLLNNLGIPHATLVDLDDGRVGGGPGRLRDACRRLVENKIDVFAALDGFESVDDVTDTMSTADIQRLIAHLRRFAVFFSVSLDLDMAMLTAFPDEYRALEGAEKGPQESDAIKAVLGPGQGHGREFWEPTDPTVLEQRQDQLRWYRYLFLGRGKPSTHLRVLSQLDNETLRTGAPEFLQALIQHVRGELGL